MTGCAIAVHCELGLGLLESTCEQYLTRGLSLKGILFQWQNSQPVEYQGIQSDCEYRIDVLIEDGLIIELKAVEGIKGLLSQLLAYMNLAGMESGVLTNFSVTKLKDGIQRYVPCPLRALRVLRGVFQILEDCREQKTKGTVTGGDSVKLVVCQDNCSRIQ